MKYRIVEAGHTGPMFYEQDNIEGVAQVLMSWMRSGLLSKTGSIWKKVRNKWVPLNSWSML